jgi:hypothetical protein
MLVYPVTFFAAASSITNEAADGGSTPQLRAKYNASIAFDDNSITGVHNGALTYNAAGGALGGYASGWSAANYGSYTAQTGSAQTYFAWYKGTQTGDNSATTICEVPLFGDDSASRDWVFGIDNSKIVAWSDTGPNRRTGTSNVANDTWHLLCWNITSATTVDLWVDGTKELSGGVLAGSIRFTTIGKGRTTVAGWEYPTAVDGVQIYNTSLSDANINAVYDAAGF